MRLRRSRPDSYFLFPEPIYSLPYGVAGLQTIEEPLGIKCRYVGTPTCRNNNRKGGFSHLSVVELNKSIFLFFSHIIPLILPERPRCGRGLKELFQQDFCDYPLLQIHCQFQIPHIHSLMKHEDMR